MRAIKRSAPVQVIVHYPSTEAGWKELEQRTASVHADAVNRQLQLLNCPIQQKLQLLSAVMQTAIDGSR